MQERIQDIELKNTLLNLLLLLAKPIAFPSTTLLDHQLIDQVSPLLLTQLLLPLILLIDLFSASRVFNCLQTGGAVMAIACVLIDLLDVELDKVFVAWLLVDVCDPVDDHVVLHFLLECHDAPASLVGVKTSLCFLVFLVFGHFIFPLVDDVLDKSI